MAIAVLDREGRLTFCNAEAEAILGVKRDEATQRSYDAPEWRISDLDGRPFPEEDLPFNRVMKTRQAVWGVQHAIETADGQRSVLSINAAPISSAVGGGRSRRHDARGHHRAGGRRRARSWSPSGERRT